MKTVMLVLLTLLEMAGVASAFDSVAAGVRVGAVSNRSGQYYEAFGDLYLNGLLSLGATAAYYQVDHNRFGSVRRDDALPVTALAKLHLPLFFIKPYVGVGQAVIFHDSQSATGSPVALAGINFSPLPLPLFLNLEYRRQFNGDLDFLAGGVGVKF